MILDRGLGLFGLGDLLAAVELGGGLFQDLGMGEQVVLDDLFDLAALRASEKLCARNGAGSISRAAVAVAASRRKLMVMGVVLCGSV